MRIRIQEASQKADPDQKHSLAVMSDENVANPHKTSQDEEESPHQSKISCNFFIIRKMVWPKVSFSSSLSLSSGGGLIQASRSRGKTLQYINQVFQIMRISADPETGGKNYCYYCE